MRRQLLFALLVNILILTVFEFLARVTDTRRGLVDRDQRAATLDAYRASLTEFERRGFCDGMHETEYGNKIIAQAIFDSFARIHRARPNQTSTDNLSIWVFGGSTSAGFSCSEAAGSWPLELAELGQPIGVRIENFAGPGLYSDDSIELLEEKLWEKGAPDYVLWAHFVNEFIPVFEGPRRNRKELDYLFQNRQLAERRFLLNRIRFFLLRLDKTVAQYSVLYRRLRDWLDHKVDAMPHTREFKQELYRLGYPSNPGGEVNNDWSSASDFGMSLAVRNYEINLQHLLHLREAYGFDVVLIRLPVVMQFFHYYHKMVYRPFILKGTTALANFMHQASNQYDIPLLDVHQQFIDNGWVILPDPDDDAVQPRPSAVAPLVP
jgi:hypothetical protein